MPAVAAEAEIVLIEVWRPQRQHHNQRREHNRPRQHQRPTQNQNQSQNNGRETATENVASASPGPAQEHNQNRQNSRRSNFKRQYAPHMAEPAVDASAQATEATASAGQHETRRDQRRDTPQGDGKGRQGRRSDDRRHGTFAKPEKAASRERAPDPNSPFAKLLILKQQMENQGGKS